MGDRLESQFQFLLEADRLKDLQRRTWLLSGARAEISAEHDWHITRMIISMKSLKQLGQQLERLTIRRR